MVAPFRFDLNSHSDRCIAVSHRTNTMQFIARMLFFAMSMLASTGVLCAETPLVVIVSMQDAPAYRLTEQSFVASLSSVQNVEILSAFSAEELRQIQTREPAMIVALGSAAVQKSQETFGDRPLLATMVVSTSPLDGVKQATAVVLSSSPKVQLEWHRKMLPGAKRVGILYDPVESLAWVEEAQAVAGGLGLEIVAIPVETPQQIPPALNALARQADSILGIPDRTVYSRSTAKAILLFSFRNRIPFVGMSGAWVKAGALYGLDWDYAGLGKQCAGIASKILGGTRATAFGPQQPETLVYQVNLKTAKQMKLDFSSELIDGASRVYQ